MAALPHCTACTPPTPSGSVGAYPTRFPFSALGSYHRPTTHRPLLLPFCACTQVCEGMCALFGGGTCLPGYCSLFLPPLPPLQPAVWSCHVYQWRWVNCPAGRRSATAACAFLRAGASRACQCCNLNHACHDVWALRVVTPPPFA